MFIYDIFSVAVQEHQSIQSMRCTFKFRSVKKFAFILLTVFAIWTLFVNVYTTYKLDGQEDGLPNIVMETLKRNRFLGE